MDWPAEMSREEELKRTVDSILDKAKYRDAAGNALSMLFPTVGVSIDKAHLSYSADAKRGNLRRIANATFSAAYFRLNPHPSTWAKSEIKALALSPEPYADLEEAIQKIEQHASENRPRLRRVLLQELEYEISQSEYKAAWLSAILLHGRYFVSNDLGIKRAFLFQKENIDVVVGLFGSIVTALDREKRVAAICEALVAADDVSVAARYARSTIGDLRSDGVSPGRGAEIFADDEEALRGCISAKALEILAKDRLHVQSEPKSVVWFLWGCNHVDALKSALTRYTATVTGLQFLFLLPLSEVRSTTGNYERVNIAAWSQVLNLSDLASQASKLTAVNDDVQLGMAANRFLKAYKLGAEDDF